MSKKTNTLMASAIAAAILMMGAQSASAHDKAKASASAIEQRLKMMEEQMNAMKSELGRVRAESASSAKVADLEAKVAKHASTSSKKDNMVFFRGGYANMIHDRSNQVFSDLYSTKIGGPVNGANSGWYVGAGLDFSLSDNLFGLTQGTVLDGTELLAEVAFDWKRWNSRDNDKTGSLQVVPLAVNNIRTGTATQNGVTMSQLTLSASPKIKFFKGSNFRPWIIPAGMAFHVISPPSNAGTVLAPGVQFGAGADYKVWDNLFIGVDSRYNIVSKELDGVQADHWQVGGYAGIGF